MDDSPRDMVWIAGFLFASVQSLQDEFSCRFFFGLMIARFLASVWCVMHSRQSGIVLSLQLCKG